MSLKRIMDEACERLSTEYSLKTPRFTYYGLDELPEDFIESAEGEWVLFDELAHEICKRGAEYFGELIAKAEEVGNEERALAFREARQYFLPRVIVSEEWRDDE